MNAARLGASTSTKELAPLLRNVVVKPDINEPTRSAVTVLVATARQSLVQAFQRAALVVGLTLVVSPDGLHTLMSAVREPPALIVLDPDVPGVEADAIQRKLARDARTARVPIWRLPGRPQTTGESADGLSDGHVA